MIFLLFLQILVRAPTDTSICLPLTTIDSFVVVTGDSMQAYMRLENSTPTAPVIHPLATQPSVGIHYILCIVGALIAALMRLRVFLGRSPFLQHQRHPKLDDLDERLDTLIWAMDHPELLPEGSVTIDGGFDIERIQSVQLPDYNYRVRLKLWDSATKPGEIHELG